MDTSDLIIEYDETDFALAIRQLLPKGQYWQDTTNKELNALIQGMSAEFKCIHDEVELALLTEHYTPLFGWRLSDYQRLMNKHGIVGQIYDDPKTPNLIEVYLNPVQVALEAMMHDFEKTRLPHTEFHWIFNPLLNIDGLTARLCGYQKHLSITHWPQNHRRRWLIP